VYGNKIIHINFVANYVTQKNNFMDLILELAYVVSKSPPKSFDLLLPTKSKTRQLYEAVISGEITTDTQAAKRIYNCSPKSKKYLMLKYNLKNKLTELVLLVEYSDVNKNNYTHVKLQCEKNIAIAEKLLLQNVFHNAEKIIYRILQTAEQYYLAEMQLRCANIMRLMYAMKGSADEVESWNSQIERFYSFFRITNDTLGMWLIIKSLVKFTLALSNDVINECDAYLEKIKLWNIEYQSPYIKLYANRISIVKHTHAKNFQQVLSHLNEIEKLVQEFSFLKSQTLTLELSIEYIKVHRSLTELDKCDKYLATSLQHSDYRAFNRFEVQELNFDIELKRANYVGASQILAEVFKTQQFEYLYKPDSAAWQIRKAFLIYALTKSSDYITIIKFFPEYAGGFPVHELLQNAHASGKDKHGYNIVLLIIKLLLLKEKNSVSIDYEGRNLEMYYNRQLTNLKELRTKYFVKALSRTAIALFETNEIAKHKKWFFEQVEKNNLANNFDLLEFIPYPTLWQLIEKPA